MQGGGYNACVQIQVDIRLLYRLVLGINIEVGVPKKVVKAL